MSLRIKLTAKRCPPGAKLRVRYQHGNACLIPEELVLRRWKDRSKEASARATGLVYEGCRVPPGTWTLLQQWLREGLQEADVTNAELLGGHAVRTRLGGSKLRAPQADKLADMLAYLVRRGVLRDVCDHPRAPASPGLPDLFLYKVDSDARVHGGQFVEVKRWDCRSNVREPVSAAQKAELSFLVSLGLKARVLFLQE